MTKQQKTTKIQPPAVLQRIKVDTDWRYGKHAKFWDIEIFDQEISNKHGEIYYRTYRGGLAYTKFGMMLAARRKLRKMKIGVSTTYFDVNGAPIERKRRGHDF